MWFNETDPVSDATLRLCAERGIATIGVSDRRSGTAEDTYTLDGIIAFAFGETPTVEGNANRSIYAAMEAVPVDVVEKIVKVSFVKA